MITFSLRLRTLQLCAAGACAGAIRACSNSATFLSAPAAVFELGKVCIEARVDAGKQHSNFRTVQRRDFGTSDAKISMRSIAADITNARPDG